MAVFPGMSERFGQALGRLVQAGWALHTRPGSHIKSCSLSPRMFHWHSLCKCSKYSIPSLLSLNPMWLQSPNLIAVPQCGSCCAPRAVLFLLSARGNCIAHAAQILTPSQMPHAIISEKFRELTSAPSFYHLPPSYSLTCFSGSKKTLIFTLLVSNKTGTNGSWQNTFSVSLKTYRPDVLEMHSVTNACLARTHLLHLSDGAEQPEQKR